MGLFNKIKKKIIKNRLKENQLGKKTSKKFKKKPVKKTGKSKRLLSKEETGIVWDTIKKEDPDAVAYQNLIQGKLKGGITYGIYFKMLGVDKWEDKPEYIKLTLHDGRKIQIPAYFNHKELTKNMKKRIGYRLIRFEFIGKSNSKYFYLLISENKYFDLPKDLALELINRADMKMEIYKKGML